MNSVYVECYIIVFIYFSLTSTKSDERHGNHTDTSKFSQEQKQESETTQPESMMTPQVQAFLKSHGIYTSVGEILYFLRNTNHLSNQKQVKTILRRYEGTCMKRGHVLQLDDPKTRHPFIVIEGLYGAKRGKISKRVAFLIRARHARFPLRHMCGNNILPNSFDGRRAYYSLSKYAGSNILPDMVAKAPVIGERYWLDQAMYSLAKTFTNITLPPPNAIFYKYPSDIIVPDLTFFINADKSDSDKKFQNETTSFTQREVECYRRIYPPIIEYSSSLGTEEIARAIVGHYNRIVEEQHFFNRSMIVRTLIL